VPSFFSHDYRAARNRLLALTHETGDWVHQAIRHPLSGADGEDIFTDVFWRGPEDASRVLVISSGTHGAEGFCGSAVQSQLVASQVGLPDDVAIMLVHAINPFGFSHLRRVNEENVDLNRNFIDFDSALPVNEAYRELNELLNPIEMPPEKLDVSMAEITRLQSTMDFLSFFKAVSGGQHEFPEGVQFGGREPQWSRKTIERIWDTYLSAAEIVVQIDVHTGLGPSGVGVLMMAANPDEPHKAITANWFGDMMVSPRPARKEDNAFGGYMNAGMEQCLTRTWVIPMTLEYGTEPPEVVLRAMIEDNWLCHHGELDSDRGRAIKERLLRVFYPDSKVWESQVLVRAEQVFAQALAGLAELSVAIKERT
jgi:hypothetical protein